MTTTETNLRKFARAVREYQWAHGVNFPQACRAILPDFLEWDARGWHPATRAARCGGGDPPESAGFDSFELDRNRTPAWALSAWDALTDDQQIEITTRAEEAEIERMQP